MTLETAGGCGIRFAPTRANFGTDGKGRPMFKSFVVILIATWLVGCSETTTNIAANRGALKPGTRAMMIGVGY
ncbi:MAG: hypothetical protein HXX15_01655 [Rhodopseudomonas sp.]|uniref:hypothetical protein n=1 Tax=Rhodopseudomonas sp. TaxID=1078 RepID=UPI00180FF7B6|nr:hypothetical protein [Rhodopseudomonas sp.]NVN84768.1 hypothetical protein [Rhodopseudomonas sp.]